MNGKNAVFGANPVKFLEDNIVNMTELLGSNSKEINKKQNLINTTKSGPFDFQAWKTNVKITFSSDIVKDMPILAYYCPFFQAEDHAPGFVDVPRGVPLHKFVFTPTMNGCAMVITDSPTPGHFRVHHHQHPVSPTRKKEIGCEGATTEYDRFSVAEYDIGSTEQRIEEGKFFGVFNFLYLKGTDWYFVSQMSEWPCQGQGDNVAWTRPANAKIITRKAKII